MSDERAHGIVVAGAYPAGSVLDALMPRALLPVAQQPLITYALRWMQGAGLAHATICANSAARSIRTRLDASDFAISIDYLEDWNPRGAAGCVRDAGERSGAGTFVVADGTALPVADLAELVQAHRAAAAVLTVVVGADATGRLCPTGLYVFDRRALAYIPSDGHQDIKERLIPRLYAAHEPVATHVIRTVAPRVVNTDTYLALDAWAVERASLDPGFARGYRVCGAAVVHECARVDPGAQLLGPVLIGPGAAVAAGAMLVGPVSLGVRTSVGRGAVVSRSVVWSDCTIGDEALVDRCMLADGARIEARRTLFAAVRTAERRALGQGRLRGAFWDPLVATLRPVSLDHL